MLVVLAMMVVTSVMMVMLKTVMIYHTCQSTETCRLHHHKLPWSRISVFISSSICISIFFLYFSVISFGFLGNGPRHITYIRNIACECATEHLTTQHVRFVPEFHLYFKVFPIILCCEASIIKHGLISNLIEGMKWHLCLDFYRISVYLINIY